MEPTRYINRESSEFAIVCNSFDGPIFGNDDIHIGDNCNNETECYIENNGSKGYECHPGYKSTLFVNTAGTDEKNYFSVLDYEVFYNIDDYKDYIYEICMCPDIIWKCIETKDINEENLKQFDDDIELLNDLNNIHYEDSNIRLKISKYCMKNPSELLQDTQIVSKNYDDLLKEWLGNIYSWKLIYRASDHEYTAKSFHEYCDDKGPTFIVIKSSGGWIFGGYTTQSWSGWGIFLIFIYHFESIGSKTDDKAFIFTLKNPHGVEPTRYMKRKKSKVAIDCIPTCNPVFMGKDRVADIFIKNQCNIIPCNIENDGTHGYGCHPNYKSSLFVDTAEPNNCNHFKVLEYEVYGIINIKDYVYNTCKYPDIISEYYETNDISEDSLKQFENEQEIRRELRIIHCNDNKINLKISQYFLKNPSEFLPNTQIVNKHYDSKLKEWFRTNNKWKLIYRASEHEYTAKSFHEYCDDKGPTLIVIKSTEGWIFGGYTTKSWSGDRILSF